MFGCLLVGLPRRWIDLSGKTLTAERAYKSGLIEAVLPKENLQPAFWLDEKPGRFCKRANDWQNFRWLEWWTVGASWNSSTRDLKKRET